MKFASVLSWFKEAVYLQNPQGNVYWKLKMSLKWHHRSKIVMAEF